MDEFVAIVLILIALFATWVFYLLCKAAGDKSRQEEKKDPCTTCLRWDECNGVDEQCPLKKKRSLFKEEKL